MLRGNPLIHRFVRELTYSPPTLTELAGRAVINNKLNFEKAPAGLISRMKTAKCCPNPACGGVYFDSQYKQVHTKMIGLILKSKSTSAF